MQEAPQVLRAERTVTGVFGFAVPRGQTNNLVITATPSYAAPKPLALVDQAGQGMARAGGSRVSLQHAFGGAHGRVRDYRRR